MKFNNQLAGVGHISEKCGQTQALAAVLEGGNVPEAKACQHHVSHVFGEFH
jgi:hypothetical protein